MRKFLYTLLFFSMAFVSCVNTPKSEIEKQAIETFKMSYAKEIKDAEFESFKTVFYTQNLCILHIEDNSLNAPKKYEYLFFTQDGSNYEALQNLSQDSIFVSENTLKKISKGKIYENLDYEKAIFFELLVILIHSAEKWVIIIQTLLYVFQ